MEIDVDDLQEDLAFDALKPRLPCRRARRPLSQQCIVWLWMSRGST